MEASGIDISIFSTHSLSQRNLLICSCIGRDFYFMKWLPAIWNYMEKMKLSMSTVLPTHSVANGCSYSKDQSGCLCYPEDISYCKKLFNLENWPNTIDMLNFTFFI